jgi:uroporphyrinogen-III synthase
MAADATECVPPKSVAATDNAPSLLIVGDVVRFALKHDRGALAGRRILLTCSAALQDKAARLVTDFGGRPVCRPLIRLVPRTEARAVLREIAEFAAVVLTSPSSAQCFLELLAAEQISHRQLPCLIACGPGTAGELARAGIPAEITPDQDFGAGGLLQELDRHGVKGKKILRLRSDKAGTELAAALHERGAEVTDCVLYDNLPIQYDALPEFDIVFFASASAVAVFLDQWSAAALQNKLVLTIGAPTAAALAQAGAAVPDIVGTPATVQGAIESLARHLVSQVV